MNATRITSITAETYEELSRLDRRACVVVIGFPRYLRELVELLEFAKSRGLATLTVTDSAFSPLRGRISLYAPAPPAMTDEPDQESSARVFECVLKDSDAPTIAARMKREEQFDSDLWWVEIEDRAGRSFCD